MSPLVSRDSSVDYRQPFGRESKVNGVDFTQPFGRESKGKWR